MVFRFGEEFRLCRGWLLRTESKVAKNNSLIFYDLDNGIEDVLKVQAREIQEGELASRKEFKGFRALPVKSGYSFNGTSSPLTTPPSRATTLPTIATIHYFGTAPAALVPKSKFPKVKEYTDYSPTLYSDDNGEEYGPPYTPPSTPINGFQIGVLCNEVLPERVGKTLHRISAAITDRGNEMVYHDWEELYNVSSYSATAFPSNLHRHFSAAVVDRGYSILFRDRDRCRTTIIPKDHTELNIPLKMRGFNTTRRAYEGRTHVALISSQVITDNITVTENGEFTFISIPSGTLLKAYLYCLLTSFIAPPLDSGPDVEMEEIKASLKEKYPQQYARFIEPR
ncbi:hypothetical protein BU23DRAFT_570158 [Bimuria novae-zelandiae CBS 107.79]|uniref:Uncharacterized protein n=1 Tax=Bimuria novae-zelandiae CBS 107.79 TaxID=1447943 RepID=A0A6A5V3C9_9PLEO|nr:hypothetical protein BU23DRAFT_570158 [Bimuria novae-zelandiae CBS 107.79]